MRRDFVIMGATLDPHAAFLIQRGMKTYFIRYEKQSQTAMAVAGMLAQHAAVERVHYPGLPSHRGHDLVLRQMQDFGTIVTFDLVKGADPARFCDSLQLFAISASLGSTESLVQPGQLMRPGDLSEQERQWAGVTDRTIRLSIGLEDQGDLIADLQQALQRAQTIGA
jgi:cystathionine beta-lyase/cystathionine gamma-synthase